MNYLQETEIHPLDTKLKWRALYLLILVELTACIAFLILGAIILFFTAITEYKHQFGFGFLLTLGGCVWTIANKKLYNYLETQPQWRACEKAFNAGNIFPPRE